MKDTLVEKYTNKFSKFCRINGLDIHYRDEGEGFPILLLHGAFSSLHTFDTWAKHLKKEYRVIRYTLPGFGLTGPCPQKDYSMESHLEYLKGFLDKLSISKCHIAGNSLGGWLAWEAVLKFPERFEKLILIAAAGYLDKKSVPIPFRMARTPFLKHVIRFTVKKNILIGYLKDVYGDTQRITDDLINRYYELFNREGNIEAFFRLVNGKHKDNTLHLKEIRNETLIMWGEEDSWLPLQNGYRFTTAIPNSRLFSYAGVGHVPMEELGLHTVRDLLKFLSAEKHEPIRIGA
jgi:pimeloyl-ACP methyl ester carboxylesterase